jgi:hypothetical protein
MNRVTTSDSASKFVGHEGVWLATRELRDGSADLGQFIARVRHAAVGRVDPRYLIYKSRDRGEGCRVRPSGPGRTRPSSRLARTASRLVWQLSVRRSCESLCEHRGPDAHSHFPHSNVHFQSPHVIKGELLTPWKLLSVSIYTLEHWRRRRIVSRLPCTKIKGRVMYDQAEVLKFAAARKATRLVHLERAA